MNTPKNSDSGSVPLLHAGVPTPMKIAGVIAIVQSLVGIVYAVILLVRQFAGFRDPSIAETNATGSWVGLGTAVFFLIVFGTVAIGAIALLRHGSVRWGRGPVVFFEMLLVPISFTMFSGDAVLLGAVTLASSVGSLILLFNPTSLKWAAGHF